LVAIRSAEMPCGTKAVFAATCGSIGQAPPEENIGTRDIDSTPPPTTRSAWPDMTWAAAWLQASRPEAQKRLTVTPGAVIA
jgi:hypothetical protein